MTEPRETVQHFVARLGGPDSENAWHALVELGPAALPHVVEAYRAAEDPRVRQSLIEVVGQYRTPAAGPFLAELLRATEGAIWKESLNALVRLGDDAATRILVEARPSATPEKQEWFDEALEQIAEWRARSG